MNKNNMKTQNPAVAAGVLGMFTRNHYSHRITALALVLAGITGSLGITTTAYADTLYQTGFEQPTFHAGNQLLGLDGWSTAIPPFLNPDAAIITGAVAKSGRQSVEVLGASLKSSGGLTGPYDAIGSYRRPVSFTASTAKSLARVDADLLLETNKPKTPGEFFSLTIAARDSNGETLGEVGLSSKGEVEAFNFNAPGGP